MILSFEEWLIDQQYRDDLIGDLARDPDMMNPGERPLKRRSDEHKNWADVVIRIAGPGYIDIFNHAWQEFLQAKLAAKDAPD